MFSLFRKKEKEPQLKDRIWMSTKAKLNALVEEWKKDNNRVYLFWFDESLRAAELHFANQTTEIAPLLLYREASAGSLAGKIIIMAEHYPLHQKEIDLLLKLNLVNTEVWSALDEPLFKQFGGDKIINMMKQLGMNEEQSIEHKFVSSSIQNAQEKIAKKVTLEQTASSQEDWMRRNIE